MAWSCDGTPVEKQKVNSKHGRDMVQVSEAEYIRNEQARLDAFAALIRNCGISVYELAKGSRVKYDTLLRALRRQSIRSSTEARIRLYINIKNNGNNQD